MFLKIDKLSQKYGDNRILNDFSLSIERGEIFGILGATSVGKSTLLRLIAGLEKTSSGNIEFDGKVSLISLNTATKSWKNIFGTKKEDEFSDTEKLQISIKRALEENPSLLLLDSPFSNLDEISCDETLRNLRQTVKEKGITVIFATNNHEEAFLICDKVGVLVNGTLAQSGTPQEVYEQPNSVAVARSLGRNNLIEAMRLTFNNQPTPEFQTTIGKHKLHAGKNDRKTLGAFLKPVTLAVRPEHISISFGASFPEDNLLKAKVLDVKYQGATTLVKLDCENLILEVLVLRLVGLNVGEECMVGISPDRILVLKD
jgi:ABC-type Fe3+/spermidine/putrescine transport system ATPase subunit